MKTVNDMPMIDPLIPPAAIQAAVTALVPPIREVYAETATVSAVVLLEGARWFARDLLGALNDPRFQEIPLKVSSYFGTTQSSGHVEIAATALPTVRDRDVLILDDIYDTGRTLHAAIDYLDQAGAKSIRTCVMFAKDRCHEQPVNIDFIGLTIPDQFVVGYGLDYQNRYRDLPYLGVLNDTTP